MNKAKIIFSRLKDSIEMIEGYRQHHLRVDLRDISNDFQKQLLAKDEEIRVQQKEIQAQNVQVESLFSELKIKDSQIKGRQELIAALEKEAQAKDVQFKTRQELIAALEKEAQAKEGQLRIKERLISEKNEELSQIYNSEAHRFFVRPVIWPLFSFIKSVKRIFSPPFKYSQNLCLAYFSAQSKTARYRSPNRYNIKITNASAKEEAVKFRVEIGLDKAVWVYFAKNLVVPPLCSTKVVFTYDWQERISCCVNGEETGPDEFSGNSPHPAGYYSLSALLYDGKGGQIDRLVIFQRLEL